MWYIKSKINGSNSIYFGQNSEQFITIISEHQEKDNPVAQNLAESGGIAQKIEKDILDACCGVERLMTYIK